MNDTTLGGASAAQQAQSVSTGATTGEGIANPAQADTAAAAAAASGATDWLTGIGEAGQTYIANNGYKNIDDALAAGDRAQKLVGLDKGQVLKLPVGDPDPANADWQAAWNAAGRPEKSDGYTQFEKIEGVPELSAEQLTTVQADVHDLGLSDRQLQGVMALYGKMGLETEKAKETAGTQATDTATASLQSEWGGSYKDNMNAVGALMDQYGEGVRDFMNDSGAGNDGRMANFLLNITKVIGEPGTLTGEGNQNTETTVVAAQASLAKLKVDHRDALGSKSHASHDWAVKERLRLQKVITP
ncbi:MAG: hypothetical protein COA69_13435 [Robiginitomaculum sp.]|nr:MAG: hypothetical protein COA69_13435 [Robiginitomaculum sp.]